MFRLSSSVWSAARVRREMRWKVKKIYIYTSISHNVTLKYLSRVIHSENFERAPSTFNFPLHIIYALQQCICTHICSTCKFMPMCDHQAIHDHISS